jgi:transposase
MCVLAALALGGSRLPEPAGLRPRRDIRQEQVIDFLRDLLGHLDGPIIVAWDRLASLRSRILRLWLRCRRLHLESLPGYALELNPNEYGWACLKGNPLDNYCPHDVEQLHAPSCASREVDVQNG